jgi:hypothetical protein
MIPKHRYWIEPRDDAKLLTEVLRYFQGGASILLEGDLAIFHFGDIPGTSAIVSEIFIPQAPESNERIVLPLDDSTIEEILKRVLPSNRFKKLINAIQIVRNDQIQFMTGDNFHHECISIHPEISVEFLERLRSQFIIKRFWLK